MLLDRLLSKGDTECRRNRSEHFYDILCLHFTCNFNIVKEGKRHKEDRREKSKNTKTPAQHILLKLSIKQKRKLFFLFLNDNNNILFQTLDMMCMRIHVTSLLLGFQPVSYECQKILDITAQQSVSDMLYRHGILYNQNINI